MPFSIIINGYPQDPVPVAHVQGAALQGMFLHLIGEVDSAAAQRLHDDARYRPYTLSPLGIGGNNLSPFSTLTSTPSPRRGGAGRGQERGREQSDFQAFRLPHHQMLRPGAPCAVRVTLLDDTLFPTVARYFLDRPQPTFQLGETEFVVTEVLATPESGNPWSRYVSYAELIEQSREPAGGRRSITLRFLTPTSFSKGNVDLPLPLPRLVFQSYLKRWQEFCDVALLPDLVELIDEHVGIARIEQFRTDTIKTKKVTLTGFVGDVTFELSKHAPPELPGQMRLLADFAFFCGTGKKTTMGMGQTWSFFRFRA